MWVSAIPLVENSTRSLEAVDAATGLRKHSGLLVIVPAVCVSPYASLFAYGFGLLVFFFWWDPHQTTAHRYFCRAFGHKIQALFCVLKPTNPPINQEREHERTLSNTKQIDHPDQEEASLSGDLQQTLPKIRVPISQLLWWSDVLFTLPETPRDRTTRAIFWGA